MVLISLSRVLKILVRDMGLILSMPPRLVIRLVRDIEVKENNNIPPEREVF